ncbi:hypothetical protein M422DRAFT_257708 [Sphaerobolus stellatus SS14]|uniref:Uncharacterized protein n=1 Tax=Sphaerobolus stellatus (strain SS14) TaxID=990650 RepID=A0A0C9VNS1_SPHS4|nr:hypothetical protein M422DRAFT_257708 [Sphaerobolus stellatus SS14]
MSSQPDVMSAEASEKVRIGGHAAREKDVLKYSIAYVIASLFTFVPFLSELLTDVPTMSKGDGGTSGGHMLATLYVLFASFSLATNVSQYPLLEPVRVSDTLLLTHLTTLRPENNGRNDSSQHLRLLLSASVCLSSVGVFWLFEIHPGGLADTLVLS